VLDVPGSLGPLPVPGTEEVTAEVAAEVTVDAAGVDTPGTAGTAGDDKVSACACRAKMSITKRIPATAIAP
jgi:hypothetical protein